MSNRTFIVTNELAFPVVLEQLRSAYKKWRGLTISMPATLEPVGDYMAVKVLKAWRQDGVLYVKLQHPQHKQSSVDYLVDWIGRSKKGKDLVRLALTPDWPGEGVAKMFLTYVLNGNIVTMFRSDYDELMEDIYSHRADVPGSAEEAAEALFGPIPNYSAEEVDAQNGAAEASAEALAKETARIKAEEEKASRKQSCNACDAKVSDEDNFCPGCGIKRCAPNCTNCGQLVTDQKDARTSLGYERGFYPWHHDWDGQCLKCGYKYSAQMVIDSGHSWNESAPGKSYISIEMGESNMQEMDLWDHRPTITICLKRAEDIENMSLDGDYDGFLKLKESFSITPNEWRAISEKLNGPLSVLLERQPWRRDTT